MLLARLTRSYRNRLKPGSGGKAGILPEAKHRLIKSAVDYLWLRDKYGVTFTDLDYELIDPDLTLEDKHSVSVKLDDIIDFSNLEEVTLEIRWYQKRGLVFYYYYLIFILRLRIQRIYFTYIRSMHPMLMGSRR